MPAPPTQATPALRGTVAATATLGSLLRVTPLLTQRPPDPPSDHTQPAEELPATQPIACSETPPTVNVLSSPSGGGASVQGPQETQGPLPSPRRDTPAGTAASAAAREVSSQQPLVALRYRTPPPTTVRV